MPDHPDTPNEPRTEAGRALLRDWGPGDDMEGGAFADFRRAILAIEAEASLPASGPPVETLRPLSDAATPGPWLTGTDDATRDGLFSSTAITFEDYAPDGQRSDSSLVAWCHAEDRDEADAALIVAAVNYVRSALSSPSGQPREASPDPSLTRTETA